MTKIVISTCYGGFGLSKEAFEYYAKLKGIELDAKSFYSGDIARDDPALIKTIEDLGAEKCRDWAANLKIVDIPDDVEWQIEEYDGAEWIAEQHRTWE